MKSIVSQEVLIKRADGYGRLVYVQGIGSITRPLQVCGVETPRVVDLKVGKSVHYTIEEDHTGVTCLIVFTEIDRKLFAAVVDIAHTSFEAALKQFDLECVVDQANQID